MSQNCHIGLRLARCGAEVLGMLESLGQQEFWWSRLASNRGDRQSGKELTMRVKDIMTTNVYTVPEESSVAAAGQLFLNHKLGCLPVVDTDHRLAGILTVTDLWRAYVALQQTRAATA
jgi:CBS-domain-containing membrane protein